MAYATLSTLDNTKILGCFTEKDYGHKFEYIENPEKVLHVPAHGGKNIYFPHLVFVGPLGETRRALIKGSVVHIVTDETDEGYLVEKWNIKQHRKYTA
jgi:hemolysin-activating ACP:hemolysin acyltransferase